MTDSHRNVGSIELLEIVSAEEQRNRKNPPGRTETFIQGSREEKTWTVSFVSSLSTPTVFLEVSEVLAREHGYQG